MKKMPDVVTLTSTINSLVHPVSSDKFTKAEATGRFFESLMEPIGPVLILSRKDYSAVNFRNFQISQDIDIFDASLTPPLLYHYLTM